MRERDRFNTIGPAREREMGRERIYRGYTLNNSLINQIPTELALAYWLASAGLTEERKEMFDEFLTAVRYGCQGRCVMIG